MQLQEGVTVQSEHAGYRPGRAGLGTRWPKRSSRSRSGNLPGSNDPAGEEEEHRGQNKEQRLLYSV